MKKRMNYFLEIEGNKRGSLLLLNLDDIFSIKMECAIDEVDKGSDIFKNARWHLLIRNNSGIAEFITYDNYDKCFKIYRKIIMELTKKEIEEGGK